MAPLPTDSSSTQKTQSLPIIGAGITGLTTAIVTSKAGINVTIIEKNQVGYGASTRNGGQTLAGLKLSPGYPSQELGTSSKIFWLGK